MTSTLNSGRPELAAIYARIDSALTADEIIDATIDGIAQAQSASRPRDGYILALLVIGYFIKRWRHNEISGWLINLASALSDLDNGTVGDVLKRDSGPHTHNRRLDPSDCWRARALVATGVDLLIRSRIKRNEVQTKLEKNFPDLNALVSDGKRLGRSALSWRDELRKGRISNRHASDIWKNWETASAAYTFPLPDFHRCADELFRRAELAMLNRT